MSRHGYSDDCDVDSNSAVARWICWRGTIVSATRGKRGQAFFRALVAALDAMPVKHLVEGQLENEEGAVCALGCLGKARGVDLKSVDTEDWDKLGELFNITPRLAQEVMYVNDELGNVQPQLRWEMVRKWAARQIRVTPDELEQQRMKGTGT